ncbi:hypothetical protein DFQ30_006880 [Apophysomyces sp. BC1015]|nr:hypothetical protein DFQ30_006880 [Apophysomyces sp. BC1015]
MTSVCTATNKDQLSATNFHGPLTPPSEAGSDHRKGSRKASVTFDLSNIPRALANDFNDGSLLSPSISSPGSISSIDISAQAVPDSILVALLDRENEMYELVRHNHAFFSSLQTHLQSKWQRFENTLYCPRSQMADEDWLERIGRALNGTPSLLEKFKELVGYMGDDDHATSCEHPSFADVDLTLIRDYPATLESFPESYPQFFTNCQQTMANENLYKSFKQILFAPRPDMPDDIWETTIYDRLDRWPDLVAQLKEIVAYEIED